ncbi:queuine tRNA-ribosyltransferase [Nitrobacter sp. Nb-311A]|nr:queuine tRNA-ribosyltransferase [Nitrobacter sp. Nb-311A]
MILSGKYADASAAIIESAQTGHVGRSLPRGAECSRAVDWISAIAGIVTSFVKMAVWTFGHGTRIV